MWCRGLQRREVQKRTWIKNIKWVKKHMMKDVCRMRGRGVGGCICVRAGANEASDGGWVEQETLLPPLTAPAWASCPLRHRAGTNYACLNICCTHAHTHTRWNVMCLCYTHSTPFTTSEFVLDVPLYERKKNYTALKCVFFKLSHHARDLHILFFAHYIMSSCSSSSSCLCI